jgi:uracil-DNA glycosylase family protein
MHGNTNSDFFDWKEKEPKTIEELNRAIMASAPLMPSAGRTVPGEGPADASIVFVGEQPGDQEDVQGRPFVGPAGQLFDRAMEAAGIVRKEVYITNAVKNFKYEMRGKRRIHQKPTSGEVHRYRWWLDKELELIDPDLIVALGATAALALAGRPVAIGRNRGRMRFGDRAGYVTVHPSFLLRIPGEEEKREAYIAFVADLKAIKSLAST